MMMIEFAWAPVLAGTVISMILGMLWYSPILFGPLWMKLTKLTITKADQEKMPFCVAGEAVIGFILCLGLWSVISMHKPVDFMCGAYKGLWIALLFIIPTHFSSVLWEKKPVQLFLIKAGQIATFFALVGGLMAVWH